MEHHNGVVPASFEELEKLPGVGHKTASVVMAQAFGVPAFPVDTSYSPIIETLEAYQWKIGRTNRERR